MTCAKRMLLLAGVNESTGSADSYVLAEAKEVLESDVAKRPKQSSGHVERRYMNCCCKLWFVPQRKENADKGEGKQDSCASDLREIES